MGFGAEDEYSSGPASLVEIEGRGFLFVAWLAKRKSGGFDLLLDREACEFEALEINQITHIRKAATTYGMVLIAWLADPKVDRAVEGRAVEMLVQWLEQQVGFRAVGKPSVSWLVRDFEC